MHTFNDHRHPIFRIVLEHKLYKYLFKCAQENGIHLQVIYHSWSIVGM